MSAENEKKANATDAAAPGASADKEQTAAAAVAEAGGEEEVREHDLPPLTEAAPGGEAGNIGLLLDVSVPVVAQLGSAEMCIRDILRLLPGSIVELSKLAGEPVDLLVRGKLFAQGEVVVVDESFGIRITKIVAPQERVESLGEA